MTGDSRGIGRTITLELARHGCRVAMVHVSSSVATEETCVEIRKMSTRAGVYRRDAFDPAQCRAVVRRIMGGLGRVDAPVNNAGIVRDVVAASTKSKDLAAVLGTNFKGAVHMIRECYFGSIRQRSGSTVNISSVVTLLGGMGQTTYMMAKVGLTGLIESAAREIAAWGMWCNAIAPGIVETGVAEFMQGDESRPALVSMRRFGKPTEVTNLVVFLAGDTSSYITGEVVRVDGGLTT